jgi:hypothetical protein
MSITANNRIIKHPLNLIFHQKRNQVFASRQIEFSFHFTNTTKKAARFYSLQ